MSVLFDDNRLKLACNREKGASEIFGPHRPSFYWLFLAKVVLFGIGQAPSVMQIWHQCNKGEPPMPVQMHWTPTMAAPTKKPSHKPTDGFAQPRFTPSNFLYITEQMNQFPILQYRQGKKYLPSKCEFQIFCEAKFWPVSIFRLSHWHLTGAPDVSVEHPNCKRNPSSTTLSTIHVATMS